MLEIHAKRCCNNQTLHSLLPRQEQLIWLQQVVNSFTLTLRVGNLIAGGFTDVATLLHFPTTVAASILQLSAKHQATRTPRLQWIDHKDFVRNVDLPKMQLI